MHDDPLLRAYRDAARIYLHAADMPAPLRSGFVERACEGSDLLRSSVRALMAQSEPPDQAPLEAPPIAETRAIAERLYQFASAAGHEPRSDLIGFVPLPGTPQRERVLAELVKLDQKARWAVSEAKSLETYLHEWPELKSSVSVIADLLRSECLARAVFGTPPTEPELEVRFPAVAGLIDIDAILSRAKVVARGLALGLPQPDAPLPPRFTNVRKIGQGGMGVVYAATDRQRGIQVAVKTLPRMDPQALLRFKREFRTLAGIAHPNLVSLYELISDGTLWLFTMEFVRGTDFVTHVRQRRDPASDLPVRDALRQLTEGVAALHAAGVLHCDLKPSNVLVREDGRVMVLDFGVAREVRVSAAVGREDTQPLRPGETVAVGTWTADVHVLGSVAYMSPEQAAAQNLTEASDWYAVGVMLYETLTGQVPFAGHADLLWAKQHEEPVRPGGLVPGVPDDLEDLCLTLLARNPEARPGGNEVLSRLADAPASDRLRRAIGRSTVFVGRTEHLRTLAAAHQAVRGRKAVTVHIHGRSGAGKTALAERFLSTLPPTTLVLAGRCYEQESVPYKALDSVVDGLCRHLTRLPSHEVEALIPPDTPALARVFPVLQRVDAVRAVSQSGPEIQDAREVRRRAFIAFGELLQRLGANAPVVLFIDDLQWGDVDSAVLLISVLDAVHPPPLLFLACYRSEHADRNPCLGALNAATSRLAAIDVDVEPLTFQESLHLASLLLPEAADGASAESVARESGGNPYFVYELARQVEGPITASPDHRAAPDLDEAIWRRVASLAPAARHLLEVIASAGKPLPLRSAATASGLVENLPTVVAALRAAHLVRSTGPALDDEIETYHDRIRESVGHHLSESARIDHHRRLAVAFEAVGHPDSEETATHFHRAGLLRKAARHYAIAAHKAAAALAFQRSAELYGLALELGEFDAAEMRELRKSRAGALANAGRGQEAAQEYQRAVVGADLREMVELQRNAGYQYCVSGHIDEGREAFASVLAHFGTRLPRTRRQALLSLLWRRFRLRLRGMAFHERREADVPRDELERVDMFWSVATGMTIADPIRGADFQTLDLILALRAGEPYRIARALAWDAAHLSMIGVRLRARANAQLAAAEALAHRLDNPHATAMILMSRAVAAYFQGEFAECQRSAEAAIALLRERCTGVTWELETCSAFAFWPLYFGGEYAALTRMFGPLIAEVHQRGARLAEADLTTFGGPFVWLAADDPDAAEREVARVMAAWSRQDFQVQHFTTLTAQAQISLYRGDGQAAWRLVVDQWSGLANAMLLHVEIVRIYMLHLRARCALAAAASGGDRRTLLRAAARDAARLGRERPPYAKALAGTIESALLAQRGQTAAAADRLGRTVQQLDACGWGCFATAARRQHGMLLGGGAGARIVSEVDEYLTGQQVKRPDRLCGVQAPGFAPT